MLVLKRRLGEAVVIDGIEVIVKKIYDRDIILCVAERHNITLGLKSVIDMGLWLPCGVTIYLLSCGSNSVKLGFEGTGKVMRKELIA